MRKPLPPGLQDNPYFHAGKPMLARFETMKRKSIDTVGNPATDDPRVCRIYDLTDADYRRTAKTIPVEWFDLRGVEIAPTKQVILLDGMRFYKTRMTRKRVVECWDAVSLGKRWAFPVNNPRTVPAYLRIDPTETIVSVHEYKKGRSALLKLDSDTLTVVRRTKGLLRFLGISARVGAVPAEYGLRLVDLVTDQQFALLGMYDPVGDCDPQCSADGKLLVWVCKAVRSSPPTLRMFAEGWID